MNRWLVVGLGSLWLSACRPEAPSTVPELPEPPTTWTLELVETLGEETDSVLLGEIGSVAVDHRDRIVVADQQAHRVYIFAPDGRLIRHYGAKGEGPGEFMRLVNAVVGVGDSLYVWDLQLTRLSVFHGVSGFVRTLTFTWDGPEAPRWFPFGLEPLAATGRALWVRYSMPYGPNEDLNKPHPLLIFRADYRGHLMPDTLLEVEGKAPLVLVRANGGIQATSRPFAIETIVQVDAKGRLWWGRTDSLKIVRKSLGGQPTVVLHYAVDPVPVSQADRDSVLQNDYVRRIVEGTGFQFPPYKPVFTTFALGPDATVWVRLSPPAGAARARWLIFDEQGRLLADAYLPRGVVEIAVGPRIIAARTHDRTRVLLFRRPSAAV